MKIKHFIAVIIAIFPLIIDAQNYDNLWAEFNKNIENKLPESAGKVLDNIEKQAVKDKNDVQLLKVVINRTKVINMMSENPFDSIINYCESCLPKLSDASQIILKIEIAKYKDDAENQYLTVLENIDVLKKTSMNDYSAIFDKEDQKFDIELEPTLYDFSVHSILNFYDNNLDKYLEKFNAFYRQLIDFDRDNDFEKAAVFNEINQIESLVDYYDDNEHNILYFNELADLLKDCKDNLTIARIKSSQTNIMMHEENYVEAMRLCEEVLAMDSVSIDYNKCKDCKNSILSKSVGIEMQHVQVPKQPIAVGLNYRNTTNPSYRIYKISTGDVKNSRYKNLEEIVKILTFKEIVAENTIKIPTETDYKEHSSLVALPALEVGSYILLMSATDDFDDVNKLIYNVFQVSNLAYATHQFDGKAGIYTLNRETGKLIGNVEVELANEEYNYKLGKYVSKSIAKVKTDRDGYADLPSFDMNYSINLHLGNDTLLSESFWYNRSYPEKFRNTLNLYTDRPIYRPGQTVQFKGIFTQGNGKVNELLPNEKINVSLRDANYQIVDTQEFTTDDCGAISGNFVLPTEVLNGYFTIQTDFGSIRFMVEEYKRPTFEVTFDKPEKEYKIGDSVRVTGNVMAFSGFGLDNVKYEYTVTRRTTFPFRCWWWIFRSIADKQIAHGEEITAVDGSFNVDFQLVPDNSVKARELPMFTYIVKVKATSQQGETREASYSLNATFNKYNISLNYDNEISCDDNIVLSSDNLKNCKVLVSNISGSPATTNVECRIYKIAENDRFKKDLGEFDRKLLNDDDLLSLFPHHDYYFRQNEHDFRDYDIVYQSVINIDGEANLFEKNQKLPVGKYIIELKSIDDSLSEFSEKFVLFEPKSTKMPFDEMCFSAVDKTTVQPGDVVNFYIGSAAEDVTAIVMVCNNENIVLNERISLSNNVKNISLKVKEEDRGMLNFRAVFVRYNESQEVYYRVNVPFDNLKLDVELQTERTNMLPGMEETWSVTIRDYKNNPVFASLMAGMYDASLDAITSKSFLLNDKWTLNAQPNIRIFSSLSVGNGFSNDSKSMSSYNYHFHFINPNLFSDIHLIEPFGGFKRGFDFPTGMVLCSKADILDTDGMVANSINIVEDEESSQNELEETPDETEDFSAMQIRSNFNETAFFYPNMKTDENGDVTFSFTMPDALTRWKLRMLAYSKDLKVGMLEKTFVTQKPVMIMADMPRFCYDEDTLWLVANVANLSDNEINPVVRLDAFEEIDDTIKSLDCVITPLEMTENIPAGRSQSVRWKVAMKKDVNLLTFRFSATVDNFSDAEQHTMPVLSTEVFMTQTFPLIAKGNEKKSYNFNFKAKDERNHAIILNFSKNPTWYTVQALPYLVDANEKYVESAFHSYFTNSIAFYILNQGGNANIIAKGLKRLQNENDTSFVSELEKNQELKEIILNETPWVMDAKNEAEQRANIVKLFDSVEVSKNIVSALKTIEKKQKPSGGWPWVEGMPESANVTQYILGGLGRLGFLVRHETMETGDDRVENITKKAFHFIENDVVKRYNDLNDDDKTSYHCSVMIVRELFVMSYFPDFETSAKFNEAKAFYVKKLKKDWIDFNFEAQAGIALIFNRNGNKNEAMTILKSLRECAQKNELGMYWIELDYNSYLNSTRRSIGVEDEARILEAFNEIDPKNEEIDAMRFWILGQKRTNMWDNDRATAEAIFAIVNRGTDWVNYNGEVTISIDDERLEMKDEGFFIQKKLPVDGDYSNVIIDNQTNHQVWGGMFRQYFVPIDKVQRSNEYMKVRREFFVERIDGDKTKYLPISEEKIKVGDKIKIVIYIENQQDMEFVYMKDLRGACFEPTEQISRYHYSDGLWYYQSTTDVAMEFFFDKMPKGKHELSHTVYVAKEGSFSAGYAVIQCQYAPEFGAYSDGERIEIQ